MARKGGRRTRRRRPVLYTYFRRFVEIPVRTVTRKGSRLGRRRIV
jgi:hypothetical protein